MKMLGFCDKWVTSIMNCVTSVSSSILINGKQGVNFTPSRGLRQGDPLSPYLFLMCWRASSLLNNSEKKRITRGLQVARGGTSINYLLFADDCILFRRTKLEEWNSLHGVLKRYEKASRQFLNKEKTSISFSSSNTQAKEKRRILEHEMQ